MEELTQFTKELFLEENEVSLRIDGDPDNVVDFIVKFTNFLNTNNIEYEILGANKRIPNQSDFSFKVIGYDYIKLWGLIPRCSISEPTIISKCVISPTVNTKHMDNGAIKTCYIYYDESIGLFRFHGYWTI